MESDPYEVQELHFREDEEKVAYVKRVHVDYFTDAVSAKGVWILRRLDERMVRLQRQGRIGTFAPIKGQEAAQIGSVTTLRPTDWMVPSFRETAAMLWRGWPIEKMLSFFAGNLEGGQPAPGNSGREQFNAGAKQLADALEAAKIGRVEVTVQPGSVTTGDGDVNVRGAFLLKIVQNISHIYDVM